MATTQNTEFNYRYLVQGETIWERIKTLQGFLEGRIRALALEEVARKKYQAKLERLKWMKEGNAPLHEQLDLEGDILEYESHIPAQDEAFDLTRGEIKMLEKLLEEAFELAEPTRLFHEDGTPYTDHEMFEANAAHEFTTMIEKTLMSEYMSTGRYLPATLKNAMTNPYTIDRLIEKKVLPPDIKEQIGGVNEPICIASEQLRKPIRVVGCTDTEG